MNINDNILDDIIREQIEDGAFLMKEAHWQKMSEAIDDDRLSTKPKFRWRWLLNGLLLLLAFGTAIYLGVSAANTKAVASKVATDTIAEAAHALGNIAEKTKAEITNASKNVEPVVAQKTSEVKIDDKINATKNNNSAYVAKARVYNAPILKINNARKNNTVAKLNTSAEKYASADEKVVTEKTTETIITDEGKVSNAINVTAESKMVEITKTENTSTRKQLSVEKTNPRYKPNAQYEEKENTGISTVQNMPQAQPAKVEKQEGQSNSTEAAAKEEAKPHNFFKQNNLQSNFYMAAGSTVNAGLTGNLPIQTKQYGVTPYVQMGLQKELAEKISLDAGLGYSSNNALNTKEKFLTNSYSFGRDTNSFHITYNTYNYVYIPLSIRYKIKDALCVSVGGNVSYMLDVRSGLWDKVYGARTSGGYGVGFNRIDAAVQLGLGINITPSICIDLTAQQGFIDISNNTYFKKEIDDKQRRATIGLRYKIGRKRF
jgi:hypothetical protein